MTTRRLAGALALAVAGVTLAVWESGGAAGRDPERAAASVGARVARGDAPLYVHIHLGADGRFDVRSTRGGESPEWRSAGPAERFDIDQPEDSMRAIQSLHAGLVALVGAGHPELRGGDQNSLAVLLVDYEPGALWRYAQWAIATAASPQTKLYRLALRTFDPGGWFDVELPRDRSRPPLSEESSERGVELVVTLLREGLEGPPGPQVTKVRLGSTPIWLRRTPGGGADVDLPEVEEDPDRPAPTPDPANAILLARDDASPAIRAEGWTRVEVRARALCAPGQPLVGVVRAPYPKGLAVPCGDVGRLLSLFRRLGAVTVQFEGAPPPLSGKEGGGWSFDDR